MPDKWSEWGKQRVKCVVAMMANERGILPRGGMPAPPDPSVIRSFPDLVSAARAAGEIFEAVFDAMDCHKEPRRSVGSRIRRPTWGAFEQAESAHCGLKYRPIWDSLERVKFTRSVWFRGEPEWQKDYCLQPGVFRPDIYAPCGKAQKTPEKFMLQHFRMEALLRHAKCPGHDDEAAWMCLARHYRLPTRLLDWSESVLTAAWLATHDAEEVRTRRESQRLAAGLSQLPGAEKWVHRAKGPDLDRTLEECRKAQGAECLIWALSPGILNWCMTRDGPLHDVGGPLVSAAFEGSSVSEIVKDPAYRPPPKLQDLTPWCFPLGPQTALARMRVDEMERHVDALVLACKAPQVDNRMMMQQAAFTMHADEGDLAGKKDHEKYLIRFRVKREVRDAVLREDIVKQLRRVGIHESTVFPDLEHLALDLAEEWKGHVGEAGDC